MTNKPTELEEFTAEQFKEMMYNTGLPDHSPLIKISARAVYKDLALKTDFIEWCNEMLATGFKEGLDYKPVMVTNAQGQSSQDFILTLACAREIFVLGCSDMDEREVPKMWVVK